jgi:hypothetical protein
MNTNIEKKYQEIERKRKEFIDLEDKLERSDIILIRYKGKYNLFGRSIQTITRSYWNHTALVFTVAKKEPMFHNTIIVEALAKGIELRKIQKYTKRPDLYDIGVKRVPRLSIEDQRKIRGYMMQNVDVPYDYPQVFGILMSYITGQYRQYLLNKDAYICSGFIQSAFYHALNGTRNVLFKDIKGKEVSEILLGYVTPKDIAKSKVTEWIYNEHY